MVLRELSFHLSLTREDLCLEMEYDTDHNQGGISRFAKYVERMPWNLC